MTHIYGYARASDARAQILSPERQQSQITDRAKKLEAETGATLAYIRTDRDSARHVRFDKRPELIKLMREIEKGDHLIVWRLDRFDRSMAGIVAVLEWAADRDIHLIVLEHGDVHLDIDTALGKFMVHILAVFAAWESDRHSEIVKAAMKWCRENGLATGRPRYGKKKVRLAPRKGQRKGRVMEVWDEGECRQIREIVVRHDGGETIYEIGQDFDRRGERTANNKPWAIHKSGKRANYSRFYRVYKLYKQLQAEGKELGEVNPIDEAVLTSSASPSASEPSGPVPRGSESSSATPAGPAL